MVVGSAIAIGLTAAQAIGNMQADAAATRANIDIMKTQGEQQRKLGQIAKITGEENVQKFRALGKNIRGQQRAAYASQGVDVGSGVVMGVEEESALGIEQDIMVERANAMMAQYGHETERSNLRYRARLERSMLPSRAFGTALGAGARIASVAGTTDWSK